jgi:hypothetical protein
MVFLLHHAYRRFPEKPCDGTIIALAILLSEEQSFFQCQTTTFFILIIQICPYGSQQA